ncbi:MFS-type transporter SLC18B1, partial [Trichoplax sp. H2]
MAKLEEYSTTRKSIIMATLCFVYTLWGIIYSLPVPFFPREAVASGLTLAEIGIIFTMYPVALFVFSPVCSMLRINFHVIIFLTNSRIITTNGMDKICYQSTLIQTLLTVTADRVKIYDVGRTLKFMHNRMHFLVMALIIRFVQGIGAAIQGIAVESAIIVLYRDRIASAKGLMESFGGLGYAIGPIIGAGFYALGGYSLPFFVVGSTIVVLGPVAAFVVPMILDKQATPWKSMLKLIKNFYIFILCFGVFVQESSLTFVETNYSIHLVSFHLKVVKAAALMLILAVCYATMGIIIGLVSDRLGYRKFLGAGYFIAVIGLEFMGSFPYFHVRPKLWHFLLGMSAFGISTGGVMIPTTAEMVRYARENNVGDDLSVYTCVTGLFKMAQSLGMICGPAVGSTLTSLPQLKFPWTSTVS